MESLDSFRQLFKYDHWANQESLRSLASLSMTNERPLKIAGHIFGAQRVWLGRLEAPGGAPAAPWPLMTVEETFAAFSELYERWNSFLNSLTPERLDEDLVHRNTKGAEFRVPIRDILMQLVLHGAYHRGQIAAEIRGAGGSPSTTDYIVYVRQHGN